MDARVHTIARHLARTFATAVGLLALLPAAGFGQLGTGGLGLKEKAAAVDEAAGKVDEAAKTADEAGKTADEAAAGAGAAVNAAQGAAEGGTVERLQGAAGVGVDTGAGEMLKGGSAGSAAKKGGAAAVQDYMKGPAGAAAPAAGKAAPAAESDEP